MYICVKPYARSTNFTALQINASAPLDVENHRMNSAKRTFHMTRQSGCVAMIPITETAVLRLLTQRWLVFFTTLT